MGRSRGTQAVGRFLLLLALFSTLVISSAFQSDELITEDEEFGLEGERIPDREIVTPVRASPRTKTDAPSSTDAKSVQINLEHAFGDSEFSPAGIFTARLKTSSHGGQNLIKLRFKRNELTDSEKESFKRVLQNDDFYTIRLPSNVLNPFGKEYVVSSIRARCLPKESLEEHFVINTEGVNILSVTYGSSRMCPYPRTVEYPKKWSFNSYTVLKSGELAQRKPTFSEEVIAGDGVEGEGVKPPEKSFWAKYWMYLIPLGLIVMNAVTQAMNLPEDPASGPQAAQRAPPPAARRR